MFNHVSIFEIAYGRRLWIELTILCDMLQYFSICVNKQQHIIFDKMHACRETNQFEIEHLVRGSRNQILSRYYYANKCDRITRSQ